MSNACYEHAAMAAAGLSLLAVVGCGSLPAPDSPEVVYSPNASAARELQVPPDLTDVSDAEQFVLPGTEGRTVTRNTLLPQFEDVRFVREGGLAWLATADAPEALWPRLLEFLRREGYTVERTDPVTGTIVSRWRAVASGANPGILRSLVGGDAAERIAFRLERDAAGGARLFARRQFGEDTFLQSNTDIDWTDAAGSAERSAGVLQELLVFLGLESQVSEGSLSRNEAEAVLANVVVQRSGGGTRMLYHHGYLSTLRDVSRALEELGYRVLERDAGVGRIAVADASTDPVEADTTGGTDSSAANTAPVAPAFVVNIEPVHVSAAVLSLTDVDGGGLPESRESEIIESLRDGLG